MNARNLVSGAILVAASAFAASHSLAETASKAAGNTPIAASAPTAVPSLVPFSGVWAAGGKAPKSDATMTFEIFKDETGGEALWVETQAVALDATGHYQVQLGAANLNGLPADLFATGEARWLEVQIAGELPSARILLASVPYALKASDAATLGGLPASAFMLAGSKPGAAAAAALISPEVTPTATDVTTTGGTSGYIPQFSGASTIVDSLLYANGTQLGINTKTPTATLTVDGTLAVSQSSTYNGFLLLNPTGTASSSTGYDSQLFKMYASAYSSSSKAAITPHFEWQVEPTGNNTATTGATLNLLATPNTSGATETGFYFNTNGTMHFASGQTFPGSGTGGGGITGVTAGSDLTGGGTSGNVTLNLDTTKIPTLAANNTFAGNETFNGSGTFNKGWIANAPASITTPGTGLSIYTTQNGSIFGQLNVPTGSNQYGWAIEGNAYNAYSGVYGYGDNNSQAGVIGSGNIGVYGATDLYASKGLSNSASRLTAAVYAQAGSISSQGVSQSGNPAALFADGGARQGSYYSQIAVLGVTDSNNAAYLGNDGLQSTLVLENKGAGYLLEANGTSGYCQITNDGNLQCSGTMSNVTKTEDNRALTTYGVQAAESWYEDYGSSQIQGGSALISLDADFGQTINTAVGYHVFLTPNGDCKGLYVTNKTATSFEVRELGGGTASVGFDYKIVAKKKGFERVRLQQVVDPALRQHKKNPDLHSLSAPAATHPAPPPVPQRASAQPLTLR